MGSLPAPPPLPPLPELPSPSEDSGHGASPSPSASSSSSFAYSPSLLIIAAILAFVVVASASIYLLLRFLSRSSSSSSSPSSAPQLIHHHRSSSISSASSALSDQEKAALIESLPLFSLASSVAVLPKSSPDCAVCLSPFHPHDELRLLPACRHAFHSPCIDTWLRSSPSCPLCRSSITLHVPPLPPPPPLAAADAEDLPRSSSFRIEIGSVSHRRTPTEDDAAGVANSLPIPPPPPQPHLRSYSLGSSFEYVVDEEVEAVVARIRRAKEYKVEPAGPSPPGAEVAEVAGGGGRSWLKEYVDWLASSTSSSFSSLRFSGRWSHRYDDGVGGGGLDSWDLEGNYQQREAEESSYHTFYRWLIGA